MFTKKGRGEGKRGKEREGSKLVRGGDWRGMKRGIGRYSWTEYGGYVMTPMDRK